MEVTSKRFFDRLFSEAAFVINAASALSFAVILNLHYSLQAPELLTLLAYVSLSTAIALIFINFTNYFSVISIFPRKSDIIIISASVSCAGLSASFLLLPLVFEFPEFFTYSSLLAGIVSGLEMICYRLLNSLINGNSKSISVVLDLIAQERAPIIEEFASRGLLNRLEILSRDDFEQLAEKNYHHTVSLILISDRSSSALEKDDCLIKAHLAGVPIMDYRYLCDQLSGRVRLNHLETSRYLLAGSPKTTLFKLYANLKKIFEPLIALLLLIVLSPLMLLIAVLIKLGSAGPAIFSQTRVGFGQKNFKLLKFRTMYYNTKSKSEKWCMPNDTRITKLGRFLRASRLDELPQLWNVIRGEMSFIGPRPEQPLIAIRLQEKLPQFTLRTLIKPGITGWAQVHSGYAASFEESKLKLEFDLFYIQQMSPRLDIIILFKTLIAVFKGDRKTCNTLVVELKSDLSGRSEDLMSSLGLAIRN